jgi:DNA-binding XRE family transcriptional regulator
MTPAEKLAKTVKPRRKLSGKKAIWKCKLKEERLHLGLTQAQVAAACMITKAALSVIENGTDPLLTTAWKLANFYGRPIEKLWVR